MFKGNKTTALKKIQNDGGNNALQVMGSNGCLFLLKV